MIVRYHMLSALSIFATASAGAYAAPLTPRWDEKTVKHSWDTVPQYWESLGHPPANTTIDLYLALKPQHENALIDTLHEVSNPRHPKYGAHLSKEQIAELVAPHPDTLNLVNSWLGDHGIPPSSVSVTLGGNWLLVTGVPVHHANNILGASYQLYQHVETHDIVLRTVSYSLPKALYAHIQTVAPTTYFGSPLTQPRILSGEVAAERETVESEESVGVQPRSAKGLFVTPSYLRWLYKTLGYVPKAADRNSIGIAGCNMNYPSLQDLRAYMQIFRAEARDATFTSVQLNGGTYDPHIPGKKEANLNLQLAEAMTFPTPNVYNLTGGVWGTATDPYLNWFDSVLSQIRIPQTISTSYSGYEYEVPPDQAAVLCKLFAVLGARGASVLFSSGNEGVGPKNCVLPGSSGVARFIPRFPASCPWVTTVGGTTSNSPEVAATISGGGFSNYFPRPFYQTYAVPHFLWKNDNAHQGLFNPYGRGYPDVSAQALNIVTIQNGALLRQNGTSHATPTVAGIISLLNDYRISQGSPPLGFLNIWLYYDGFRGLNDITSGSNPGCGTEGFTAVNGWDPVTGLGTLDFVKLGKIIDQLPKSQTTSASAQPTMPP